MTKLFMVLIKHIDFEGRRNNMKKVMTMMLVLVLCITLSSCGKSEAAELVDSLILSIGTVTLDSEEAITKAEYAYSQLPDKDREKVENLVTLMEARTTYDGLLELALRQAEETDKLIQQAREIWETCDVSSTLAILDSITLMTVEQEETINAFYAEIEESCYVGTHFVRVEHLLKVGSDNQLTVNNAKFEVSHDETKLGENTTYHLYGFFGDNADKEVPGLEYTRVCGKQVSIKRDYPELWSKWAIFDKGAAVAYPTQACMDDLGNILAYFYRFGTDYAELEFTILRNIQ